MADPLDVLYKQNTDYQARHDGTLWIVENAAGWGLAFDNLVYRVWSAFDGRATGQVIADLGVQAHVSAAFLESTAKVLARAGMLIPSQPLQPLAHATSAAVSDLESFPLVSIIILASRQAREHLEACLPSVLRQTYPNLDIILVDNQTTDDSAAFARENYPQVRILSTPRQMGFSDANNWAMKQAHGEFYFLVNEDTEMEPECITECARVMARSERIAAVAPKMKLFYMRDFINSMGNSTHPNGQSHDNFIGYLDVGQFDATDQVFTACFGAAMLRRSAVDRIGYMDERFFVYYSDADWAFRARIYGYDVVAAPRAVVYHKFTATISTMASMFKLGLIIYSRLRFAWKNFDFQRARRFLWLYLKEDLGNLVWALYKRRYDVAGTYFSRRLRWVFSLPEVTLARWQTRRARHPLFSDDAAFAMIEGIPRPAMYGKYPVIAAHFVRSHYMRLEPFRPESAPAQQDLGPSMTPALPAPSLLQKAWRTLRSNGLRGLVRETENYVRWRISSL
jgi:GT2 family glycosyltransferase